MSKPDRIAYTIFLLTHKLKGLSYRVEFELGGWLPIHYKHSARHFPIHKNNYGQFLTLFVRGLGNGVCVGLGAFTKENKRIGWLIKM